MTSKAAWDTGTLPLKVGEGGGRREKKNKIEIQRLDVTYSGAHNFCQGWDGVPGMYNSKSRALDQCVIWPPTKAGRKWSRWVGEGIEKCHPEVCGGTFQGIQ